VGSELESFLALHENAFRNFGGPEHRSPDNLKAAWCALALRLHVIRWTAFARLGFTPATLPANRRRTGSRTQRRLRQEQRLKPLLTRCRLNHSWSTDRTGRACDPRHTRRQVFATSRRPTRRLGPSSRRFCVLHAAHAVHRTARRSRRRLLSGADAPGRESRGPLRPALVPLRRRGADRPRRVNPWYAREPVARESPAPASVPTSLHLLTAASGWSPLAVAEAPTRSAASAPAPDPGVLAVRHHPERSSRGARRRLSTAASATRSARLAETRRSALQQA